MSLTVDLLLTRLVNVVTFLFPKIMATAVLEGAQANCEAGGGVDKRLEVCRVKPLLVTIFKDEGVETLIGFVSLFTVAGHKAETGFP